MKKLANPQQEIYQFICSYTELHSYPPSVREICEAVGLRSTATVHAHLKTLEKQGLIIRDPAKQRSIQLNAAAQSVSPDADVGEGRDRQDAACVPLVGRVAAGIPILASENIEDAFPLPSVLLHGNNTEDVFMLRVDGDSMHNAGIYNGDLLVVRHVGAYVDGDIVVARIQGESATVKRLYREKERIRLQPENDLFEPIYAAYRDVEIAGKVIGLLRSI